MKRLGRTSWILAVGALGLVTGLIIGVPQILSAAGPPNATVQANQGAPGSSPWPVTGNVSITGSLPSGTNDIGTVHVAASGPVIGEKDCSVPDGSVFCSDGQITGLATGTIVNTLSVSCGVQQGNQVDINFQTDGFSVSVPLTLSGTDTVNHLDHDIGTLTSLGIPVQAGDQNFFNVEENYTASGGNGAHCSLTYAGTSAS
jgi:hypothetical protein